MRFIRVVSKWQEMAIVTKNVITQIVQSLYYLNSILVCDLCGKVTVAQNLKLHMATHHAPKTFEYICNVCGKGYSTKNILDKHVKRHNNPDSLINKWMTEPGEFKFECKEHENCKKYFKSEKRLKEHLKKYAGKTYPNNLARQYVPNLPENHSTIVNSTNIQMQESLKKSSEDNNKPYKKRKKELEESVALDKKLQAFLNNKRPLLYTADPEIISNESDNVKVEALASAEAMSPAESDTAHVKVDNYHPIATMAMEADPRNQHHQFYSLYQAGHVMASGDYSAQSRPFRPFPDLSSHHANY